MNPFLKVLLPVCVGMTFAACKTTPLKESAVKVTNGVDTGDYPEVIALDNGCSGTWLSPTVVITAGHCVEGKEPSISNFRPSSVKTQRVNGKTQGKDLCETDIAILRFSPANAARIYPGQHLNLASIHPHVDESVTLVGFGCDEWREYPNKDCQHVGSKREGTNTIASFTTGAVMLRGAAGASSSVTPGTQVLNAPGDSGGALLNTRREIIGITSTGNGSLGFFTSVNTPEAAKFLADALGSSDLPVKPRPAIDPYQPPPAEVSLSRARLDAAMNEFRTWFEQEHPLLLKQIDDNLQSIRNTQDEIRDTQEETRRLQEGLRK